jgi:hypothetical protein
LAAPCLAPELVKPLVGLLPTVVEPFRELIARLLYGLVELDVKMGEGMGRRVSASDGAAVVSWSEKIAAALGCLLDLVGTD